MKDEAVSMRERMARALAEDTDRTMPRFVQQKWDDLTDLAKAAMFRRADAVLDALMEPDEGMLEALHDKVRILVDPVGRTCSIQNEREVWQAMLTAARSGSSGER